MKPTHGYAVGELFEGRAMRNGLISQEATSQCSHPS